MSYRCYKLIKKIYKNVFVYEILSKKIIIQFLIYKRLYRIFFF